MTTSGQQVERGQGGMGTAKAWRQCHGHGGHGEKEKEKEKIVETPLVDLNSLQKGPSTDFDDLKEAFKHFCKNYKNSCGLPLTLRSFTKICVAK